jgi:cytochrome c oxidase subunit 2
MNNVFKLLPEQASTVAGQIDALYVFLVAISVFFTILTAVLVVLFAVKYRRRSEADVPEQPHEDSTLEIVCGSALLVLVLVIFGWGAKIFFDNSRPPADAMEILVVGKQWMWKLQHPNGKREINSCMCRWGQPVKLTMTSEDVIHSFFIPAFRVKQDVVPGRYTKLWFEATKPGTYHLFCTEYCGTEHSRMGGISAMPWPQPTTSAGCAAPQRGGDTGGSGGPSVHPVGLRHLPQSRLGRSWARIWPAWRATRSSWPMARKWRLMTNTCASPS